MSANSRYTVAVHVLTLLAHSGGQALSSAYIAGSVNTNPVVIRRLMGALRIAKLVASQAGPTGGWRLSRPPQGITLRDIYRAVEGGALFPLPPKTPNPRCPVGGMIQQTLERHIQAAQFALEKNLERVTIADLVQEVRSNHA